MNMRETKRIYQTVTFDENTNHQIYIDIEASFSLKSNITNKEFDELHKALDKVESVVINLRRRRKKK